jgi:hypothetical protein
MDPALICSQFIYMIESLILLQNEEKVFPDNHNHPLAAAYK